MHIQFVTVTHGFIEKSKTQKENQGGWKRATVEREGVAGKILLRKHICVGV